jgi:spore coat polysaccharide biosynthesis protein SpsF
MDPARRNQSTKVVAIIQARMGSSRLPGKVLKKLEGKTVLARVVARVSRARLLHEAMVATTTAKKDESIVEECGQLKVPIFRGDEQDVLDRYYRAAQEVKAEVLVRITADCPLIDPELIDETIGAQGKTNCDYASNALERTYPRGLDVEVFTFQALERAWREARLPYQREHVTPYLYEHPEQFRISKLRGREDLSHLRWTLDTPEDLACLSAIYERFHGRDDFGWKEVLSLLDREPEIAELNRQVTQKDFR